MGSWGAAASGVEPCPSGVAPIVGAFREEVLFLVTQVVEMGSHLKEALRDHRRFEEALKATCAGLDAIEAEVEAAHIATDGAEACRVGMYLGKVLFHGCLGGVPLIVVAL
jgi:hypothetical protein